MLGDWLSERLGQQFIIDNRSGAASNIATEFVAASAPDGYTLFIPVSTSAINATLYKNQNFDFVRDIAPVASIGRATFVMAVTPSRPRPFLNSSLTARLIPAGSTWVRKGSAPRPTFAANS